MSGGCFLCAANIQWQQAGLQLGYEIDLSSTDYVAWANPFPLLPGSCVVAARAHVPQGWERNGSGPRLERVVKILRDLVALSRRLPGFIVFHNGVGAGATIPSHLHFHVLQRQAEDGPFPLEVAAREEGLAPHGSVTEYPLEALYWCGEPAGAVEAAAAWIRHWVRRNAATESKISANIVSGFDFDRGAELYFVPRDQSRSHSPEISGGIGGLEVLGEIPFCTAEEGRRLERGEVDYHTIERILASVRFR